MATAQPAVWHAVRPIHRLRRYVTARYYVTDRPVAEEGMEAIRSAVAKRRTVEGRALTASLPPELRVLCEPEAVKVTAVGAGSEARL